MRWGCKMGNAELIDTLVHDGLTDVFNNYHMGITAENLAEKFGISREEQDEYAAKSQQKAEQAIASGHFSAEIAPVVIPQRKATLLLLIKMNIPAPAQQQRLFPNCVPLLKQAARLQQATLAA